MEAEWGPGSQDSASNELLQAGPSPGLLARFVQQGYQAAKSHADPGGSTFAWS